MSGLCTAAIYLDMSQVALFIAIWFVACQFACVRLLITGALQLGCCDFPVLVCAAGGLEQVTLHCRQHTSTYIDLYSTHRYYVHTEQTD